MSADKKSPKVLIYNCSEDIKMSLFEVLSKLSWKYYCLSDLTDFQEMKDFSFTIAFFEYSSETLDNLSYFVKYKMQGRFKGLDCPLVLLIDDEDRDKFTESLFDHVVSKKTIKSKLLEIAKRYYRINSGTEGHPGIGKVLGTTLCKVSWIDEISIEINAPITFHTREEVFLKGDIVEEYSLNTTRFVAHPDPYNFSKDLRIRMDGVAKESQANIRKLNTGIKDNKIKIIAMDDDEEHCLLVQRRFEKYPEFDVRYALNAKQLFSLVEEKCPDIFIIDLNLMQGDYDGFQVVKFLREQFGEFVLIFMLSRMDLNNNLSEYYSYGFNDFFSKPLDLSYVMAKIAFFMPIADRNLTFYSRRVPQSLEDALLSFKLNVIKVDMFGCILSANCEIDLDEVIFIRDNSDLSDSIQCKVHRLIDRIGNSFVYECLWGDEDEKLWDKLKSVKVSD